MRAAIRAALMGGVIALLAGACSAPPPPLPPAWASPVLFVHGYGTSSAVFSDMIEHLKDQGYPPGYLMAVDLVPNTGSNAAAAEQVIAPAVEQLVARAGGGSNGKVDIVAHSMGALSSRWYTARIRPDRVRTLLTVAGANHGTDVLCGYPDQGGRDLCPAFAAGPNPVQTGLNGTPDAPVDETPYGRAVDGSGVPSVASAPGRAIRYIAVLVPDDRWIRPNPSSELDGADEIDPLPVDVAVEQVRSGNLVFQEPTEHDTILENEQFFMVLDAILAQARPT